MDVALSTRPAASAPAPPVSTSSAPGGEEGPSGDAARRRGTPDRPERQPPGLRARRESQVVQRREADQGRRRDRRDRGEELVVPRNAQRRQHAHSEDRHRAHLGPTFPLQSAMFRLTDGDHGVAIV
jgi:hypothetical protein